MVKLPAICVMFDPAKPCNLTKLHFFPIQVERAYIARKSREKGWREIVIYRKEHAAAGLIQRWTRGVLVRRRTPLVRDVRARSVKVAVSFVDCNRGWSFSAHCTASPRRAS